MIPIEKVQDIIAKHDNLEKELSYFLLVTLIANYLLKSLKNTQI